MLQILRHLGRRNRGAKYDRAHRKVIAVLNYQLSDIRMDTVGTD
jgi:hypothetical protein